MRLHPFLIIIHECWKEWCHSLQCHRDLACNPIDNDQPMLMPTVPINSVSHPSRKDVGIGEGFSGKEKGFSVGGVTEDSVTPRSYRVHV